LYLGHVNSGGTFVGAIVATTGAITASGNLNIGANSLIGAYSGIYNDGKWLTGSDGYGSFSISPNNASFLFAPPAAGTGVGSIDYQGRFNALLGFGVGSHDPANTTVRYYRNETGPKASIRAAGGTEIRTLDGSADAALTCSAITASGNVTSAGDLVLASGSTGIRLVYNSSGVGTIYNHPGTDFGRLNLGGTTSSFPAIKRSGTTTAFRLADDSADGPITCGAITASGAVTLPYLLGSGTGYSLGIFGAAADISSAYRNFDINAPTGTIPVVQYKINSVVKAQHYWETTGSGALNSYSAADHMISSGNATFLVKLGGFTNTYPAIKRSGTTTAFRLADDSADGPISCGAITASDDITLAFNKRLFLSNGATTGNYLISGSTAVLVSNAVPQAGWNSTGFYARQIYLDYVNEDVLLARHSTGPALNVQAAGGLRVLNLTGSADAALTCGAITASGTIITRNGTSPTSIQITNTYTSSTSFGLLDIRANAAQTAYEISSFLGSAGGANLPINIGHRDSAGAFTSAISIATNGAITASGQIVEVPPSSVTLSTNGQFSIEMTSNTEGNLVYRGSDGTTRRCALLFI
jgi:hypothetical protein